jgi:hypothetical protein
MFEPPGVLRGQPSIQGIKTCGIETIQFGANLEEIVKHLGGTGFRQSDNIEWQDFCRMLAKIGYSFIVGVFGLIPLDQVLVLPFIRGETQDAGHWIGSRKYETESERRGAIHGVSHIICESIADSTQRFLVARVKLFASLGATGYEVVIKNI